MKNLIMAFGLTMVMIISVTILAAMNTNTAQQSKLDNATELAAYQTLNEFYGRSSEEADLQKTKDNIADRFQVNLEKILDAESGIKGTYEITIYGVDETQGMLSVKVTEHYKNLSFDRTITSEATVIHEAKAATP